MKNEQMNEHDIETSFNLEEKSMSPVKLNVFTKEEGERKIAPVLSAIADVIAKYAGSVAVECFGIVGMAAVNMKDGLVKLLKRDYLNHGINVKVDEDNEIIIDFHVIVAYGISISTVSDNLIETVKYKVESFTGMKIKKINIYVEGVRVID